MYNPLYSGTFTNDITGDVTDIQIVDYRAAKECSKQQVNLSMNTFSILLEGHKEVFSDTTPISISNSEFLLMRAGKCLMTEKFTASNHGYRSMLLFFSNEAIFRFSRKYELALSRTAERRAVRSIPFDAFVHAFVASLAEVNKRSPEVRDKVLEVKFEELMLYLTDTLGPAFLESLLIDLDDHTFHFLNVVEHNKLNKLTLKELAFLSNMSVSTFKREFEKRFQASPGKWFQERRLEYAAFLLKNESRRPSDIYQDMGYDSLTNFIQAFKTKFGQTPKQYQLD